MRQQILVPCQVINFIFNYAFLGILQVLSSIQATTKIHIKRFMYIRYLTFLGQALILSKILAFKRLTVQVAGEDIYNLFLHDFCYHVRKSINYNQQKKTMKSQNQIVNQVLQQQLQKIWGKNQNTLPIYLIISNLQKTQVEQMPIKLYPKQLSLKDLVVDLNKKYQKYQYVYVFGKEKTLHSRLSLKQKKRLRNVSIDQLQQQSRNEAKVMAINQQNQNSSLSQMHQKYKDDNSIVQTITPRMLSIPPHSIFKIDLIIKDDNNLLVIVISQKPLIRKSKPKYNDYIFIILAAVCVTLYLILTFTPTSINTPSPL